MLKVAKEQDQLDSLGMKLKQSSYEMATKKSLFTLFGNYLESNPALAMTTILLTLVLIYIMALFEKLVLFHYIGIICSIVFMFWISLSDDARTGYKLISIGLIFMGIIIFISA